MYELDSSRTFAWVEQGVIRLRLQPANPANDFLLLLVAFCGHADAGDQTWSTTSLHHMYTWQFTFYLEFNQESGIGLLNAVGTSCK